MGKKLVLITKIFIATLSILLFLILFISTNHGLYFTNDGIESQVNAYYNGTEYRTKYNDVLLCVPGDSLLREQLTFFLEEEGFSVTPVYKIEDNNEAPVLYVKSISRSQSIRSGQGKTNQNYKFTFISSGDTYYINAGGFGNNILSYSSDGLKSNQLIIKGQISLKDDTRGLFNYNFYRRFVAKKIANSIVEDLHKYILATN
jgi:hypothetical protein